MQDTIHEDHRLRNLGLASRSEGPNSHKDNSKQMGNLYPASAKAYTNSKEDSKYETQLSYISGAKGDNA